MKDLRTLSFLIAIRLLAKLHQLSAFSSFDTFI